MLLLLNNVFPNSKFYQGKSLHLIPAPARILMIWLLFSLHCFFGVCVLLGWQAGTRDVKSLTPPLRSRLHIFFFVHMITLMISTHNQMIQHFKNELPSTH